MGRWIEDRPYDFAIVVYDRNDTADEAFDEIKNLEDEGKLHLVDAAVFTRTEKGRVRLENKGYVATGKGRLVGLGIGIGIGILRLSDPFRG